ncbi:sugar transferase [Anaerofustis butyriciformans]|uniref:sugar transferase n=1 Tax=Anaerofustis butyriciformans TaxID=3108533 RepID=UPI002E2F7618|nr:sugar transferase [Anaerofustis sp. HA2171]
MKEISKEKIRKYNSTIIVKRLVDIICALLLCIAFIIPGVVIAIIIKLSDGGKIFFVQERIGRYGKSFKIIKFRTMKEGSEKEEKKLLKKSRNGFVQIKQDPRVTEFGKFLRKTSFDEIPQLINVLKGDMSLIGPRPFIPIETDLLNEYELQRNIAYPGLTGLAQLKGRSKLNIHEVVKIDLEYLNDYSLLLDLKIFFSTIFVVLKGI